MEGYGCRYRLMLLPTLSVMKGTRGQFMVERCVAGITGEEVTSCWAVWRASHV